MPNLGKIDGFARPQVAVSRDLGGAGTAGCIVRRNQTNRLCILSNAHVMAWSYDHEPTTTDPIYLLGPTGTPPRQIATLTAWSPTPEESAPHRIDAAIAELDDQADPAIDLIGKPANYSFQIFPDMKVYLRGAHSGFRRSKVSQMPIPDFTYTLPGGRDLQFPVSFSALVLCKDDDSTDENGSQAPFAAGGDSGSAVYDNSGALVGILMGRSDISPVSAFCRIEHIFQKFDLTIP